MNAPDRVWMVLDASGNAVWVGNDTDSAQSAAVLWDKDCPSAAPHVVHEYRLHRPADNAERDALRAEVERLRSALRDAVSSDPSTRGLLREKK